MRERENQLPIQYLHCLEGDTFNQGALFYRNNFSIGKFAIKVLIYNTQINYVRNNRNAFRRYFLLIITLFIYGSVEIKTEKSIFADFLSLNLENGGQIVYGK